MATIRTIEQKRSEFALKCIEEVVKDKNISKDYKSLVKKFPMMVLKNGFLQAVVFLESKGKEHHSRLLEHLKKYLTSVSPLKVRIDNDDLPKFLSSKVSISEYRNITTDILAFTKWLGRYADALIEEEESG